jgi:hypothetical protein
MSDLNTVTYYPYTAVNLGNGSMFNIYSGTPVDVDSGEAQPPSTSPWKPHDVGAGMASYFDGVGWIHRLDVRVLSLARLKSLCLLTAQAVYESTVGQFTADYTPSEQKTWSQQLTEANAVLGGGQSLLISSLAAGRNETPTTVAKRIVAKGNVFNSASATALAALQKTRMQINAATKISQLPEITLDALRASPSA